MLDELEARAGGVKPAMALLGMSQNSYYTLRRGGKPMQPWIEYSIEAHLRLNKSTFAALLKERQTVDMAA